MKTEDINQQQQIQVVKPLQSKVRKNKAEASKGSKTSQYTRRRQQPDSSEQYLLPAEIPKSSAMQSTVTEGFQNQSTKAVIRLPYNLLLTQKFSSLNCLHVQNVQIMINVKKQLENITIFARSAKQSTIMQVEKEIKKQLAKDPNNNQKIQENNPSEPQDFIVAVNIWGKFVYLSGFETQNKVIKKIRKDLSSFQESEIAKFKIKQVNSDMFIYLNLRLEEKYSDDFNGLINQGNTCYMNSYLQTLYHIPAFRNLVYQAEIQEESKFPATLQELFFNLTRSQKAVSLDFFVKSFGWGKSQVAVQQDAQQFSCLFFEVLERKLNESAPEKGYRNRTIEGLFKGQLNHYLRCTQVGTVIDNADFRRQNSEDFIDLQLPIYPTLTESLDAYTTEGHLEGDNKYDTVDHGLQQAYKGVQISYFPPILMIQLKRFQYCFEQQHNIKILASLQYPEEFDFSPWSITGEKEEYELYAVLVHEGAKAQSGHYYNFVKEGDLWYKFNDEIVQQVSKQKALKYNFGGFHESIHFDAKEMKVQKKLVESKTTAYMLVYVKKQFKQDLMTDANKLPEWIEKKNCFKSEQQAVKKNRKKFFHNVGLIDWQQNLEGKSCSDMGFLDEFILENSRKNIDQIPKEVNILEWLSSQNIIETSIQEKKKKPRKPSKIGMKSDEQKPNDPGIYVYYASPERQNLIGFSLKPQQKMQDLLKLSADLNPIILKAPFQVKKDEYLAVIKRFSVGKKDDEIEINFKYETVIPLKKDITYIDLLSLLEGKFSKNPLPLVDGASESIVKPSHRYNYYIDDWKYGPIKLSDFTGLIPNAVPNKNQLLVCVIAEIASNLTVEEEEQYSFHQWYQNKKDTINLIVAQEKKSQSIEIKDVHVNLTLAELRKLIFQTILKEKQEKYESHLNIVLRSRLKKGSKMYSQVAEPQFSTLKDLIKIQNRIEFSFSSLTVQSRLSQFVIQFYYRTKNFEYSESIQIVLNRNQESQTIVKLIKQNQRILQLLETDGFSEDQAELIMLSKDWLAINDIVTNEGKIISKGDFGNFLKTTKNPILVVEGRTTLNLQGESKVEIKQEDDPFVNILVHHVSQSIQKVGIPRYFRADRRIQLHELKNRILNLIKDDAYGWEGKIYMCNPFKVRLLLYGKDNKRAIQLTDLESLEEMKRLRIQEKMSNSLQNKRKKSRDIKNSARKQSCNEQAKDVPLEEIREDPKQEQTTAIKLKPEKSQSLLNGKPIQSMEISNGKDQAIKGEQEQNEEQILQEEEVTTLQGPETIYGIFPKVKVLKMQIIHNYLIKPNIALRLNVDD